MWPIRPGRVGIAGLALHSPFYLALTLMMGVLTDSRGQAPGRIAGSATGRIAGRQPAGQVCHADALVFGRRLAGCCHGGTSTAAHLVAHDHDGRFDLAMLRRGAVQVQVSGALGLASPAKRRGRRPVACPGRIPAGKGASLHTCPHHRIGKNAGFSEGSAGLPMWGLLCINPVR